MNIARNILSNRSYVFVVSIIFAIFIFLFVFYFILKIYFNPETEYKNAIRLYTPKITEKTKLKNDKEQIYKENLDMGHVLIRFERQIQTNNKIKKIADIEKINVANGVLQYATSNSAEYEYLDYAFADDFAYFLARKSEDKSSPWHLYIGQYDANSLPIVYNSKKLSFEFEGMPDINISPDGKYISVSSEKQDQGHVINIYSIYNGVKLVTLKGKSPAWLTSADILYSDKMGNVYVYNIQKNKKDIFWSSKHDGYVNIRVSNDKSKVALYFSQFKRLILLDPKLKHSGKYFNYSIDLKDFILSPSGKYLLALVNTSDNNLALVYTIEDDNLVLNDKSVINNSKLFDFYYSDNVKLIEWVE